MRSDHDYLCGSNASFVWLANLHYDCGKSCQHSSAATYALAHQVDLLVTSAHHVSIPLSHKRMTILYYHYEG